MPSTSKENHPSQRRVLNVKAFAILAGAGTLLWIGMSMLHAAQVVRTSEFLKQNAEQALADDDHRRAFDLYEQYLGLKPNDNDAEEKISQLLDEHGTSVKSLQRAFQINERLLRLDSSRDDLRVRQIRIADRLGRYSDAAVHLKKMREAESENPDVWHFSGIVAQDTGKYFEATEYFRTAVNLPNPNPESFEFLAKLLTTESNDPVTAEQLLERLVVQHDSAKSRRIRAAWLLDQDRPMDAIPDLWQALATEPDDTRTNAMMLKAVRLAKTADRSFDANRQYQRLISHLQRQVSESPNDVKLRLYLSSVLWSVSSRDAAIRNLEVGIERDPRQMEMHEVLVDYLVSDRRYQRAQEIFDRIPVRAVDRGRREFMRGRLLMSQKQWTQAINAFEMALGFASQDRNMASRARVCLALCRRESGDYAAAKDTYRALIQSNPDFEGGRLGMASAYLRTEQVDLAIAEYRQLLHVDGVPAFLANLMIKHNLTLPKQSREWSEIEAIVSDRNPQIADEMQRVLLQADLLFAQGYPSQAMDLLDEAGRKMPERPEIARAYQRLSAVHGDRLMDRIRRVLDDDATNIEAHSSILRLYSARKDTAGLTSWMNGLVSDSAFPQLSQRQRLQILAETTTFVADAEQLARGASSQSQLMLQYGQEAWRQLASLTPQNTFNYVQFLARHRNVEDAMEVINRTGQKLTPEAAASCWLECLRQRPEDPSAASRVNRELLQLIRNDPSNVDLRIAYVENQLLTKQYSAASSLLQQLAEFDATSGRTFGRLAWLSILVDGDSQQALKLSERAAQLTPSDKGVRTIRGLALAEANQTEAALRVLTAIPRAERSMASYVFEARALQLAGRQSEAAELIRSLGFRRMEGNLVPAEMDMFRLLQKQLNVVPPQMTSR